jgi:hypothetical protein
LGSVAFTSTEVGGLVHIFPNSIECDLIMEVGKPLGPPSRGLGIEEIGESSITRPNLTDEYITSLILYKDILFNSICINVINFFILLIVGSNGNTSIDDGNIMHLFLMEILHKTSKFSIGTLLVIGEIAVVFHVIDVGPLSIERNASC